MERIDEFLDESTSSTEADTSPTNSVKLRTSVDGTQVQSHKPAPKHETAEFAVEDHMYQYYKICYPDEIKSFEKKYKVTFQYDRGVLNILQPSNSGSNASEALRRFKAPYENFTKKINIQHFNYSEYLHVTEEERDEAISVAMENKKVFVGYGLRQNRRKEILIVGMNKDDIENALYTFRNLCMPEKNVVLARAEVKSTKTKVSIIHGDYIKEDGDILLSKVDEKGDGRIVSSCGSQSKTEVKEKCLYSSSHHFMTYSYGEGTKCNCLLHYVVEGTAIKCRNIQKAIADALSFVPDGTKKIVIPVFKPHGSQIASADLRQAVLGAIKEKSSTKDWGEVCIIHNNLTEAQALVDLLKSSKKYTVTSDLDADKNSGSRKSSVADQDQNDACPICLDDLDALGAVAMKTLPCKHTFHQHCIDQAFSVSMKCPMCMKYYGKPAGNQPKNGKMKDRISSRSLPGYGRFDTIVIEYYFPDGTQGPEHPSPGMRYTGTSRTAYLPNNEEGKELLLLLRKAFEARLTFTIGRSVTTGCNNVVTWNDIHHKTSPNGGPAAYGYPDPSYMGRLKMELADKGITRDGSS